MPVQEVGHRGYICPNDGKIFNPLDLSHLFDPSTNAFVCDQCATELIEHDPSSDPSLGQSTQDHMQRFNVATASIPRYSEDDRREYSAEP